MRVLGIETSCDETSAAIVEKQNGRRFGKVLSEVTVSQINKHKKFGGVVPELASREHSNNIDFIVQKTFKSSNINLSKIDAFAATTGPGLLGGLLVGTNYAKALAISCNKPFLSINHLQGHVLIPRMSRVVDFPFICLLVSGGHCQILLAKDYNKFKVIGETLDDAVGEAYDKIAKILGYDYPGGPIIEKLALKCNGKYHFNLPKPLIKDKSKNLSFSGLKTAVRRIIEKGISNEQKFDLANEFQTVICECLINKVELAINSLKDINKINTFILSGGVASNLFIRRKFKLLCKKKGLSFIAPEKKLCTDNATMIAWAGHEILNRRKKSSNFSLSPKPRWRLDSL